MDASAYSQPGQLHRHHQVFVAVSLVLALLVALSGVAEAQAHQDRSVQLERVRPTAVVETLRLACAPDIVDGERGVLCRWSEATNPQTRGYKLLRITDGSPRELVATVGVNGRLGYFDAEVTSPSSLVYGVVSVNRSGRLTGRSAPVYLQLGQEIEPLQVIRPAAG